MYKPKLRELRTLIGNPDVYAVQTEDGKYIPVREPLTDSVLRQHRAGEITVGTYVVQPPNLARTLVFDIDSANSVESVVQRTTLESIIRELPDVTYFIEESGGKGWHIWLVADEPLEAEVLYRLGRGVREEAGLPALEVFPKQTEVRDLGNLVKLPGGVHRVTGRENNLMAPMPEPNSADKLRQAADLYPEVAVRSAGGCQNCGTGQQPCVYKIQQGVDEGGRNIHLFHLATMLRKFSLTDENVEMVVRRANEASKDGPLPEEELITLLENSRYSGPVCGQLNGDVHCGDECILTKHSGLYTRRGGVRYAQPGERVVVEVSERTDDGRVLEVTHPDLVQGRVIVTDAPERKGKSGN